LARGRRFAAALVPAIATIGTLLTEYQMGVIASRLRLLEGVVEGAIVAVLMAGLAVRLRTRCENPKVPDLTS
jgi:hypothetical protein